MAIPQNTPTYRVPAAPVRLADRDASGTLTDDGYNPERIQLVKGRWHAQDTALIERDRAVDISLRMLMGDQWSVWSPVLGQIVDLTKVVGVPEMFWRELPKINFLAKWFDLTVARLTENPPVLRAIPADADRVSALLADAADVLLPKLWDETGMRLKSREMAAWLAAAGWCFTKTRVDFEQGDERELVSPAVLSMQGQDGSMIERLTGPVPFDAQGNPLASLVPPTQDGDDYGYAVNDGAAAHVEREGMLCPEVLSPLECRGEWGSSIPWQRKKWHIHRTFLDPEYASDLYHQKLEADTSVEESGGGSTYLLRILRGTGHYGAGSAESPSVGLTQRGPEASLVCVDEMWERPSSDFPEGRLLTVTQSKVLDDGPRPFPRLTDLGLTSPISYCEYSRVPGRPFGTTPLETRGIALQRAINQGARQILRHRAFSTTPVRLLNTDAGITEEDLENGNRPDGVVPYTPTPGVTTPPVQYLVPPNLSGDVWKTQEWLENNFYKLMDLEGAEGAPATASASGELQKELRFNSDRPVSTPVRNLATCFEEMGSIWLAMLPVIWPEEKVIAYTGKDRIAKTLTLLPDMWDGAVKIDINAESMLPRSRQEREAMAFRDFSAGVYGQPGTPEAMIQYFRQAQYPTMDDADLPTGVDKVTAEHVCGMLMQGTPAPTIGVLEQWNIGVHKQVVRDFMAAPEFLTAKPQLKANFEVWWQMLERAEQLQAVNVLQRQTAVQAQAMAIKAPLIQAGAALQAHTQQMIQPPEPQTGSSSDGQAAA